MNNISANWHSNIKITVTDPQSSKVFEDTVTVNLSPSGNINVPASFALPLNAAIGTYTVKTEAWYGTWLISSASIKFELPKSQISVAPKLPSAFISGNNVIPFTLNNIGKISVYSGILDISFKDPEGIVVYSGSQAFSIGAGQNTTLNIPVTVPSLKFGNYILTYTQSDETRTGEPNRMFIPNECGLDITLDKSVYKIGETANIKVAINNSGKFLQDGSLTVDIPAFGFADTIKIVVAPSEILNEPYALSTPVTLNSGGDIKAVFTDPSGNQLTKTSLFQIIPRN
jgi:hypothetical protein